MGMNAEQCVDRIDELATRLERFTEHNYNCIGDVRKAETVLEQLAALQSAADIQALRTRVRQGVIRSLTLEAGHRIKDIMKNNMVPYYPVSQRAEWAKRVIAELEMRGVNADDLRQQYAAACAAAGVAV